MLRGMTMNIVAHNLTAINAQRQFGINSKSKTKSTEKLSSGYKINRAADDAAGLAISEKMRRQIRGLKQGVENTQDGVSLCQVADGALAEVNDMLHRITELSVKSANGTNSDEDRQYIQEEVSQILQEIDRIGDTTTFNERRLFTQVADGADANTAAGMTREQAIRELKSGNFSVGTKDVEIDGKTITQDTIKRLASAYSTEYLWYHYGEIYKDTSKKTEVTSTFQQMAENIKDYMIGQGYGRDGSQRYTQDQINSMSKLISDHITNLVANQYTDYNAAMTEFGREENSAGFGMGTSLPLPSQINNLAQLAARYYTEYASLGDLSSAISNQAGMAASTATQLLKDQFDETFVDTKLWSISFPYNDSVEDPIKRYIALAGVQEGKLVSPDQTETLNVWIQSGCEAGVGMYVTIDAMDTDILGIRKLNVSTVAGAECAMDSVKGALQKVSANRAKIGAQQNRLEHTIANEENIVENTTAAESQIRDTDMAKEMVKYSKDSILEQVGYAMMAQANQSNAGVLALLK